MEINDLRIALTLASLVLFVALWIHTWSRRRAADHAAAAQLPFQEDAVAAEPADARGEGSE